MCTLELLFLPFPVLELSNSADFFHSITITRTNKELHSNLDLMLEIGIARLGFVFPQSPWNWKSKKGNTEEKPGQWAQLNNGPTMTWPIDLVPSSVGLAQILGMKSSCFRDHNDCGLLYNNEIIRIISSSSGN